MQCTICHIDLCIKCFKSGVKIRNHEYNHKYRIIDNLEFMIEDGWTGIEVLLFLEALSLLGIANWDDISEFIGTKTNDEVESFFYRITGMDDVKRHESSEQMGLQSNPNIHDVVSYMPFRKDFEIEYDNDYETIFKELNNDTGLSNEHKTILQEALYSGFENLNQIRKFRKFVILDKNIVNIKELQATESTYSEQELEVLNEIKPFAKFLSKEDFNQFFSGILIESELKRKIKDGFSAPKNNFVDTERKRENLLSDAEKEFCFKLKLTYKEYLMIKYKLSMKRVEGDVIDVKKLKSILNCHDENVNEIFEFFRHNKWI